MIEGTCAESCTKPRIPGELGIWMLIGGDLLVFTLFFVLVAQGSAEQPQVFAAGRASLNTVLGVANTLLLLTGSYFVALAVHNAHEGDDRRSVWLFRAAALCGGVFIADKVFEWSQEIAAGKTPATDDFFMLFYVFTGIHLIHVLLATLFALYMAHACKVRPAAMERQRMIESGSLFWHLVDLLWIVLFALFYLI